MDELIELLSKIDSIRDELKEKVLPPDVEEELWTKFRLEWNYNSNHIEGNTLTYGQTELLLLRDQVSGDHDIREIDEMKAHDVAVDMVRSWANDSDRELSETDIRQLNQIILVRPFYKQAVTSEGLDTTKKITPGVYKSSPNHVRLADGSIFKFAEPEDVPSEMEELIKWYSYEEKEAHPIAIAASLHYKMVRIHPFDDGNGRVSRLVMNYHLLRSGLPPVIIKSKDKNNYFKMLNRADVGDVEAFIGYVARQSLWSLALVRKAHLGEDISDEEDWNKELELLGKRLKAKKKQEESDRLSANKLIKRNIGTYISQVLQKLEYWSNPLSSFFTGSQITLMGFPPSYELKIPLPVSDSDINEVVEKIVSNYNLESKSTQHSIAINVTFPTWKDYSKPMSIIPRIDVNLLFDPEGAHINEGSQDENLRSSSYGDFFSNEDFHFIRDQAVHIKSIIEKTL